jgi:PRTRC genetic system protein C
MSSDDTNPQGAVPAPRRLFRYGDHTFADPGAGYTPEAVQAHLAAYLPELGQAIYSETTLPDGTLEIAFRKQVTTKGRPGRGPA